MAKYRILWFGKGKLNHNGVSFKNVKEYSDDAQIPVLDDKKHPINEGLRKLEKAGRLKIEWVRFKPNPPQVQDVSSHETAPSIEFPWQDMPTENETDVVVESEPVTFDSYNEVSAPETDVVVKSELVTIDSSNEISAPEIDIVVQPKTRFALEDLQNMKITELDEICRELGIRGYSTKDKAGKIELILQHQS